MDGGIAKFQDFQIVQLIDLDAAMGKPSNDALVRYIASRLPCQVGGGVRSIERAQELLDAGARRVILGSSLFNERGVNKGRAEAFAEVLDGCAGPRAGEAGTWLSPAMRRAYTTLHRSGLGHSVEVWMDGELAGGLYGVALGRMFFGESMFTRRTDASKIALAALVSKLLADGYGLIDCQMHTPHLASLGATTVARRTFINYLEQWLPEKTFCLPSPPDQTPVVPASPWGARAERPHASSARLSASTAAMRRRFTSSNKPG